MSMFPLVAQAVAFSGLPAIVLLLLAAACCYDIWDC